MIVCNNEVYWEKQPKKLAHFHTHTVTESKIHMNRFVDTKYISSLLIYKIGGVHIHISYLVHRTVLLILNLLICFSQKSFPNSHVKLFHQNLGGGFDRFFPSAVTLLLFIVRVLCLPLTHSLTPSLPYSTLLCNRLSS